MKKILLYLSLLATGLINAQEVRPEDGIRYSLQDINGTARFRAMSGAFGALGGDLSSLNVNPAGSVFFNNNYASISASVLNSKNKSNYFGTTTNENSSTLDLNQLGAVFIFTSDEKNWNKIALGFNYENMKDFDNDLFLSGTNPNNSISKYFVDYANLYANSSDFAYDQAQMGYDTYIIDPTSNPDVFVSNVPSGGNYYQANAISTTGFNGKMTANVAASYRDFLSIGLNLNLHITDYVRSSSLYESNSNPENTLPQSTIREIRFDNEVYTYGTGFSFNLGAIVKPTEFLRLGLSYESPTWYRLNKEVEANIIGEFFDESGRLEFTEREFSAIELNTTTLSTPLILSAGGTFFVGKNGFITADVDYVDYSQNRINSRDFDTSFANSDINAFLGSTLNYRVGGEYRFDIWRLRAGYAYYGDPSTDESFDRSMQRISGGVGVRLSKLYVDFTLINSTSDRIYNSYSIFNNANQNVGPFTEIRNSMTQGMVTVGFNF